MQKKKMWVQWEDGADLSKSRKQPGDYSPLTRDEDNNLGHVILSDIDEDDYDEYDSSWDPEDPPDWPSEEELEAMALAVIALIAAACAAAPHINRWWRDQVMPFMQRSVRRARRRRRATPEDAPAEPPVVVVLAPSDPPTEVTTTLQAYKANMSSEEARDRFVAALVARMFSDQQLQILGNAHIDDDGSSVTLASAVSALTPEQLAESMRLMLEANPSWPDGETVAELERILQYHGDTRLALMRPEPQPPTEAELRPGE